MGLWRWHLLSSGRLMDSQLRIILLESSYWRNLATSSTSLEEQQGNKGMAWKAQRVRPVSQAKQQPTSSAGFKQLKEALDLLERHGIEMDSATYASLLRQCGSAKSVADMRRVHQHVVKNGQVKSVENLLIEMYGKCGSVEDARAVFDRMEHKRNVFSWNVMMGAYCNNGFGREALALFKQMDAQGVERDRVTHITALSACCSLRALAEGKAVHQHIIASGLQSSIILDSALVNMYGRCGSLAEARRMFDSMPVKNVVSWNTMIAAYAQNGHVVEAIELFTRMKPAGMKPDMITFLNVLGACCNSGVLEEGRLIHEQIVACGLDSDVIMGNAVVNMYGKCGSPEDARRVFDKMPVRDVVSWNAIIAAYAQQGYCKEAFEVYQKMETAGVTPDTITFTSVLGAFCSPEALADGKAVHASIVACGLQSNVVLETALLNMYGKCGSLQDARGVFDKMRWRTTVTWNALIAAYVQYGYDKEALDLYHGMKLKGVTPDEVTYISILPVCPTLEEVKEIHAQIVAKGFEANMQLGNALISAYSNCCSLDDAVIVFERMQSRNVVSWTATIVAYVEHGHGKQAVGLYRRMVMEGVKPDSVACVGALDACTCIGSLAEGKAIHGYVEANRLDVGDVFVGTALVNMYGKCGSLVEARRMFDKMHWRNVITWNAMIGSYAQHGHADEALKLYGKMDLDGMKPDSVTFICILFACSHLGLMEQGRQYFISMMEDHQVAPAHPHYGCVIDLLARAGWMEEAEELIKSMPVQPGPIAWTTLLGACKIHNDVERGARAARQAFDMNPGCVAPFVLLSNIYSGSSIKAGKRCRNPALESHWDHKKPVAFKK